MHTTRHRSDPGRRWFCYRRLLGTPTGPWHVKPTCPACLKPFAAFEMKPNLEPNDSNPLSAPPPPLPIELMPLWAGRRRKEQLSKPPPNTSQRSFFALLY